MKKLSIISICALLILTAKKSYSQWDSTLTSVFLNDATKNIGIGTSNPYGKLNIANGFLNIIGDNASNTKIRLQAASSTNDNSIVSKDENSNDMWVLKLGERSAAENLGIYNGTGRLALNIRQSDGHVAIGTTAGSTYMFQVCGNMRAELIRVQASWCDYVFEKDYKLQPLKEVKQFILKNKHLPNVTPGYIIESGGLDLGENASQIIRKVEENTLYLIEHNEQIESVLNRLKFLEEENSILKKEINKLKKNH